MRIEFDVDKMPVVLERNWFWGGMKLRTPAGDTILQHPLNPSTHFSFRRTRTWEQDIAGRCVRIEKTRSLWFAGARPQKYVVHIDGQQVISREGY